MGYKEQLTHTTVRFLEITSDLICLQFTFLKAVVFSEGLLPLSLPVRDDSSLGQFRSSSGVFALGIIGNFCSLCFACMFLPVHVNFVSFVMVQGIRFSDMTSFKAC